MKRQKINEKEAGVGPFFKKHLFKVRSNREKPITKKLFHETEIKERLAEKIIESIFWILGSSFRASTKVVLYVSE